MLLEYRLESVLGAGGFGITYLGWDTNLEKHVAIKEYLPGELAIRALDGSVVPVNTENEYNYKWGLDRFIQEARTLAKFSHPNIVRVNRFFEANGTSYMVMDYEAGESLNQHLRRVPTPDEATLKNILLPIFDGLQAVHQAGFLHRDIKPSNVFIRENGVPVLLDFGSARMATGNASQGLTAIVSPGYAPLEQYSSDGNQGPWSDVYALSGVMYRAVTNENPPDAVKRMKSDPAMQPLAAARGRYSERFLKTIEWGMMPDEKMRPQSIAEWRELLLGRTPLTALNRGPSPVSVARAAATTRVQTGAAAQAAAPAMRIPRPTPLRRPVHAEEQGSGGIGKWLIAGIVLIALVFGAASWSKRRQPQQPGPAPSATAQQAEPGAVPPQPQSLPQTETPMAAPLPPAAGMPAQVEPVPAPAFPPASAPAFPPTSAPVREMAPDPRRYSAEDSRRFDSGGGPTEIPMPVKKEFELADRDGNGFLTPDEIKGRFPFIEQNFSLVDGDGDGRISPYELWQLRRRQQPMRQRQ